MVGSMLRQERERQNLTVKDIERGTSIRALYIEAIEKETFDVLPGEVYAKGFVRNYANFLGLDAERAVQQFREDLHIAPPETQVVTEVNAAVAQKTASPKVAPVKDTEHSLQNRVQSSQRKQGGWVAVAAVALFAIAGGAYYFMIPAHDVEQKQMAVSHSAKDSAKKETSATESKKNEAAQAEKSEMPKGDGIELVGRFTADCWLHVVADGKTLFEGTAEAGKTMEWKGKEKIQITAGNAGAVELTKNGKKAGKLGDPGEVVEKVFTKEGAR